MTTPTSAAQPQPDPALIGGTVGLDQGDGSTRPIPAPPSDAEVEAALAKARHALRCLFVAVDESVALSVRNEVEAAFAALRSENAALTAERDEWQRKWSAARGEASFHQDRTEFLDGQVNELRAERDALRGEVRELVASASPMNVMPSGRVVDYALTVSAATLARLQSESARGGEEPKHE